MTFDKMLRRLNEDAPEYGRVEHVETVPFGPGMRIERFRLANGLQLLLCEDHAAPVFAYHSWFRVGSRHERPGKTGISHLFEHLMFGETTHHAHGVYDRTLEEAGAENNASTWLDWTQYTVQAPATELELVVGLEADRMENLVLRDPQVASEKEVVANERRYRVDDDVDGAVSEVLWATAFEHHAYRWPTIGWMPDIEGFTTADCVAFYGTYYAPNNATLIVTGDVDPEQLLRLVSRKYGHLPPSTLPVEDIRPEPAQAAERRQELHKPTTSQKLVLGYRSPAYGDHDHGALQILNEVLLGGQASRLHGRLVRDLEYAVDVSGWVGAFEHPALWEVSAVALGEHTGEEILAVMEEEFEKVRRDPITDAELERARARAELALLGSLESAEGKAWTIGYDETVLRQPAAAFQRLAAMATITPAQVRAAARRYLRSDQRTVLLVRPSTTEEVAS